MSSTGQPQFLKAASPPTVDPEEVDALEHVTAVDRVRWAWRTFGDEVVLSTSFGIQSAVMLHLVTQLVPDIPVVFVDTGYLFPETLQYADELTGLLKLNLKTVRPAVSATEQVFRYGRLWEQGEDGLKRYNLINKIEPMDRALREMGASAWLAGLRREQASTRRALRIAHVQQCITKIYPIIDWTRFDVDRYLQENDLPDHPLREQGYVSVGDWHSTSKLQSGMTEEQTRFKGAKRECGLHEPSGRGDFKI